MKSMKASYISHGGMVLRAAAGSRYGYKRGYQDGEADTLREVDGLMDEMRAEIAATRRLRALHGDEDVAVECDPKPLNSWKNLANQQVPLAAFLQ
jgi:hypothetical protein